MQCRRCGADLAAAGCDLTQGIASCPRCHSITTTRPPTPVPTHHPSTIDPLAFSPSDYEAHGFTFGGAAPAMNIPRATFRSGPIAAPFGISEAVVDDHYELHYRWFDLSHLGVAAFAALTIAAGCGAFGHDHAWIMELAAEAGEGPWKWLRYAPFLVVAAILYYVLAGILNSSTIRIADGEVAIEHGPLPWWGEFSFPTSDVRQFFCTQQVHYHKRGWSLTYSLEMLDQGGQQTTLLSGFPSPEQPLFLEQQLEAKLQIPPELIGGEIRRT